MSISEKRIKVANQLRKVLDPEIGMNIVDVGLIYNIIITEDDFVRVEMTLTTPGCPLTDYFLSEIETVIMDLDFVSDMKIDFVWEPKWDLKMMDEEAKQDMFKGMRG
jgi:metal-sulfur cluster biosynthetic enzyme